MELKQSLALFVTQLEADGRANHTIRQYQRHIRRFETWCSGDDDLTRITHETIASFMTSTAARLRPDGGVKKATSVNALRTSLRVFCRYAHDVGWLRENPARLLRPAICGRPLPRALTADESSRLLSAITNARDHALFATLLGTGIRIGSCLALDIPDVDLERGELLIRHAKGDRVERVYVARGVREILVRHIGSRTAGPVFTTRRGSRISSRHTRRRLKHWLSIAGINRPASPHSLRHAFATRLLEKTGNLQLVQRALRHRNIESTLVYAQMADRCVREAIEQ